MKGVSVMKERIKNVAVRTLRFFLKFFWFFPIKNKVLFSSYEGKRLGCNPEAICQSLIKEYKCEKKAIVWCAKQKSDFQYLKENQLNAVKINSFSYFKSILTCKIIVMNDLSGCSYLPFRKSQFIIQTWHGCGLYKKVGHDVPNQSKGYHDRLQYISSCITLFSSGAKAFTETVIRNAFGYKGEVKEIGLPRNDCIINEETRKSINIKVRKQLEVDLDTTLILVAPTFRNSKNFHCDLFNNKQLQETMQSLYGKYKILFRTHYMSSQNENHNDNIINVNYWHDMQELLCASDILISDYSSCIWDFSLSYKPCFIFAPDLKEYKLERDFYMDITKWPFPLATTIEDFCSNIMHFNNEKYILDVQNHFKELGHCESGKASKELASIIMQHLSK